MPIIKAMFLFVNLLFFVKVLKNSLKFSVNVTIIWPALQKGGQAACIFADYAEKKYFINYCIYVPAF